MNHHHEVFQLCYHGKGGFQWSDIYCNMPIPYRKLYIRLINDEIKRENEALNKNKNNRGGPDNNEVLGHMEKAAKMDKDNKTGLNLQTRLDQLKSKSKPNGNDLMNNKVKNYYDEEDDK